MTSMVGRALLTGALAFGITTTAQATSLSFTLAGIFDINLGGNDFNNVPLTLKGTGTTAAGLETAQGYPFILFSSLDAIVSGYGTFAVPSEIVFYYNPGSGVGAGESGFIDFTTGNKVLTLKSPVFTGYDGQSNLTASGLSFENAAGFSTPFGTAKVVEATNLILQASSDVPEPAAWAMMVVGFGFVGAGLRHRQRIALNFS